MEYAEYKVIIGRMLFFFPAGDSVGKISPSRVRFLEKGPHACDRVNGFLVDQHTNTVGWYVRGTAKLAEISKEHVRFLAQVAKFFGRMQEFHLGNDFWFCLDTESDTVAAKHLPLVTHETELVPKLAL